VCVREHASSPWLHQPGEGWGSGGTVWAAPTLFPLHCFMPMELCLGMNCLFQKSGNSNRRSPVPGILLTLCLHPPASTASASLRWMETSECRCDTHLAMSSTASMWEDTVGPGHLQQRCLRLLPPLPGVCPGPPLMPSRIGRCPCSPRTGRCLHILHTSARSPRGAGVRRAHGPLKFWT
jgi:hypothetical protein